MLRVALRRRAIVTAAVAIAALASGLGVRGTFAATNAGESKPASQFTSPNPQTYGAFGHVVAASDGILVIGSSEETANGVSNAGRVYIFDARSGALIATLTSPNARAEGGAFGRSVAASRTSVVVGAPNETAGGFAGAGHAYVFSPTGSLIATLTSPAAQASGAFGISVAVSGTSVVVGADAETANGLASAGHAYLCSTACPSSGTLTSPNASAYSYFGASVGISGTSVVVGAPLEYANGNRYGGHAYLCSTACPSSGTLTSPNTQPYGFFGNRVAISGATVVVGAPMEFAGGLRGAGHAYLCSTACPSSGMLTSPSPEAFGAFGFSVAVRETSVLVGAPAETAGGFFQAGHAYLCSISCPSSGTLTSPNAQAQGYFGNGVGIATQGRRAVLVGAPGEAAGGSPDAGHAYLFHVRRR
jgi:hypothetical protein